MITSPASLWPFEAFFPFLDVELLDPAGWEFLGEIIAGPDPTVFSGNISWLFEKRLF